MASVAPTVTRTSLSGFEVEVVPGALVRGDGAAQLGDAGARRVLVVAVADGVGGDLLELGGAVGIGEALAEIDRVGGDGQLRHGGEDRRGERAQALRQLRVGVAASVAESWRGGVDLSVPGCHARRSYPAISGAYGLRPPCSASPTTTCTAGWTGGAGPSTIVAAIGTLGRRRHRARGVLDDRGRGRGPGRGGGPGARVRGVHPRSSPRAGGSARSRTRPTPGSPGRSWAEQNRALYMDGVRPPPEEQADARALARGRAGIAGASPCWCDRRCPWRRRGSCT